MSAPPNDTTKFELAWLVSGHSGDSRQTALQMHRPHPTASLRYAHITVTVPCPVPSMCLAVSME